MKLPPRYQYTLNQKGEGRICVLTVDVERVAAVTYGTHYANVVTSDHLATVDLQSLVEPSVTVTIRDCWEQATQNREHLAEIYPGVSDDKLREMGFGYDLDYCDTATIALS